jgi:hypothetical protein
MLAIYALDTRTMQFTQVSVESFIAPVLVSASPGGTAVSKKLFLRNDDITKYYTDITLSPCTLIGDLLSDQSPIRVKILSGEAQPSASDWASAAPNSGAVLNSPISVPKNRTFPEIGSPSASDQKYYPFWLQIALDQGTAYGEHQFSLKLVSTEHVGLA